MGGSVGGSGWLWSWDMVGRWCWRMQEIEWDFLWFKKVHSGVRVVGVMYVYILKNVCLFWAVWVFWSRFFCLLFLRVDCECNWPFHATAFKSASAFNGDLNQWDVGEVATMLASKSIRMLENDLTWRELMLLWLKGSVGGLGLFWWCDVQMVER